MEGMCPVTGKVSFPPVRVVSAGFSTVAVFTFVIIKYLEGGSLEFPMKFSLVLHLLMLLA